MDSIGSNSDKSRNNSKRKQWYDKDVQLMLAFQSGQQEVFKEIVLRNQKRVYSIIYRLIGNHADSEDLTQEVFLRVFRTAKTYKPMAKFSTWLYRIATNVALNAIRARRKGKTVSLDMTDSGEDVRHPWQVGDKHGRSPESYIHQEELINKINKALEILPENQRISFILNKYEHLSYREIADILGCSTMAVKSLLTRARCNLQDALKRYLGADFVKHLPNHRGDEGVKEI
mgnify:CR=1 FL=1